MKKVIVGLVASLALAAAGIAQAQAYGEVGYTSFAVKTRHLPTLHLGALGVTAGYTVNPYLSIEGLLAKGVKNDSATFPFLGNVTVKTDYVLAAFVKPKYAFNEKVEVFAKLGWMKNSLSVGGEKDTGNDVAYGLGGQVKFTPQVYGTAGYTRFYNKNNTKVDGWNIGVGYKF